MVKKGDIVCNWEIVSDVIREKDSKGNSRAYVDAKCLLCGTIYPKRRTDNIGGKHSQSCRHCQSKNTVREQENWKQIRTDRVEESAVRESLTGKTYGFLDVLKYVKHNQYGEVIYTCHCNLCNSTEDIIGHRLTSSQMWDRCSKCRSSNSVGERLVYDFLTSKKVKFTAQQTFSGLTGKHAALRFDFAIWDNDKIIGLIEVQGAQHYKPIEFFGGEKQFKVQLDYDNRKRGYCLSNNIPLLEYSYIDVENKNLAPLNNFLIQIYTRSFI